MQKSNIKLLRSKKEWLFFISILFFIAFVNIANNYYKYLDFSKEELYEANVEVLNIYYKKNYQVLRIKGDNFEFYTSLRSQYKFKQFDKLSVLVITTRVSFFDFIKGFYAPIIEPIKIGTLQNIKTSLASFVENQHTTKIFKELYNALFFAIPYGSELREIAANFGISHLIAISGFHLAVIAFIVYWMAYFPYSFFHKRYFPYANKKYHLLLLSIVVLFFYLLFTLIIPSFLRAFVMFIVGVILLRNNIKLLSFETLLIALLLIISFFPKYLFSISLWFSICGVFYIYLYLEYFKNISKVGHILLFNPWIYLAMNPITNFFFGTTSYLQLFSSPFSLAFTIFYPIIAILHLFGLGGIFDEYIGIIFSIEAYSSDIPTPFWFFLLFIALSLVSIKNKLAFIILNILSLGFTVYIFYVNLDEYYF